ncbi:MAG: AarF/ABC1/UbiB kinase family protein [Pseudomonadota bacterium]
MSAKDSQRARQRSWRLATMSASVASQVMKHKAAKWLGRSNQDSNEVYRKIGSELAQTLGQMKGLALKAGQVLAQIKDLLPPEIVEALSALRHEAEPVDFSLLEPLLLKAVGRPLKEVFAEINTTAIGAASLGQVHYARLHSGEEVAIKIQYPEVAQYCRADLLQLKRLAKIIGLTGINPKAIKTLINEVEWLIVQELDYRQEAETLAAFHQKSLPDWLIIPKPFLTLSNAQVLVMTFEQGIPLDDFFQSEKTNSTASKKILSTREQRSHIANAVSRFVLAQVFDFYHIHIDPHAGNFAWRNDGNGKLVVYDFGATRKLKPEWVMKLRQLLQHIQQQQPTAIDHILLELGSRNPEHNFPVDLYKDWLELFYPVIWSQTPVKLSDLDLHHKVIQLVRAHFVEYMRSFQPVGDMLWVDRAVVGHYWNLMHLESEVNFNSILEPYV